MQSTSTQRSVEIELLVHLAKVESERPRFVLTRENLNQLRAALLVLAGESDEGGAAEIDEEFNELMPDPAQVEFSLSEGLFDALESIWPSVDKEGFARLRQDPSFSGAGPLEVALLPFAAIHDMLPYEDMLFPWFSSDEESERVQQESLSRVAMLATVPGLNIEAHLRQVFEMDFSGEASSILNEQQLHMGLISLPSARYPSINAWVAALGGDRKRLFQLVYNPRVKSQYVLSGLITEQILEGGNIGQLLSVVFCSGTVELPRVEAIVAQLKRHLLDKSPEYAAEFWRQLLPRVESANKKFGQLDVAALSRMVEYNVMACEVLGVAALIARGYSLLGYYVYGDVTTEFKSIADGGQDPSMPGVGLIPYPDVIHLMPDADAYKAVLAMLIAHPDILVRLSSMMVGFDTAFNLLAWAKDGDVVVNFADFIRSGEYVPFLMAEPHVRRLHPLWSDSDTDFGVNAIAKLPKLERWAFIQSLIHDDVDRTEAECRVCKVLIDAYALDLARFARIVAISHREDVDGAAFLIGLAEYIRYLPRQRKTGVIAVDNAARIRQIDALISEVEVAPEVVSVYAQIPDGVFDQEWHEEKMLLVQSMLIDQAYTMWNAAKFKYLKHVETNGAGGVVRYPYHDMMVRIAKINPKAGFAHLILGRMYSGEFYGIEETDFADLGNVENLSKAAEHYQVVLDLYEAGVPQLPHIVREAAEGLWRIIEPTQELNSILVRCKSTLVRGMMEVRTTSCKPKPSQAISPAVLHGFGQYFKPPETILAPSSSSCQRLPSAGAGTCASK